MTIFIGFPEQRCHQVKGILKPLLLESRYRKSSLEMHVKGDVYIKTIKLNTYILHLYISLYIMYILSLYV